MFHKDPVSSRFFGWKTNREPTAPTYPDSVIPNRGRTLRLIPVSPTVKNLKNPNVWFPSRTHNRRSYRNHESPVTMLTDIDHLSRWGLDSFSNSPFFSIFVSRFCLKNDRLDACVYPHPSGLQLHYFVYYFVVVFIISEKTRGTGEVRRCLCYERQNKILRGKSHTLVTSVIIVTSRMWLSSFLSGVVSFSLPQSTVGGVEEEEKGLWGRMCLVWFSDKSFL